MATKLEPVLPTEVVTKIKGESRPSTNEIVLLMSVDDSGFPNVALLSYLDLFVASKKRLLLAIGSNSSSRRNLLKRRNGTLLIWGGTNSGVFYIKGKISLVKKTLDTVVEGFMCTALALTVELVSQDYSPVAKILSTLTYDTSKTNPSHFELQRELKTIAK